MRQTRFIIGFMAAGILAACGGSGAGGGYPTTPTGGNAGGSNPGSGTPASGNTVTLSDAAFQPGTLTVPAGTTVTWQWASCTDTGGYGGYASCVSHSVLFDDGVSSSVQTQGTFTRAFSTKGTYKYHCAIHGTAMSGQITVD